MSEDTEMILRDIFVTDTDLRYSDDNDVLRMEISVDMGVYSLTRIEGLDFTVGTGTQDEKMTFAGKVDSINRAIAESVFKPSLNYNSLHAGRAKITFSVRDSANVTRSEFLAIRVNPVNDAPVIMLPGQHLHPVNTVDDDLSNVLISVDTIISSEDAVVLIPAVSVRDVDAHEDLFNHGFVTITVEAVNGTVWLTRHVSGIHRYLVGNGMNDTIVSFISSVEAANEALRELAFQGFPNFNGHCGVWVSINDTSNSGININNVDSRDNGRYKNSPGLSKYDRQYVPILLAPINDEPTINLPSSNTLQVMEDHELVLLDLSIDDVDNNKTEKAVLTLTAEHGSVTLTRMVDLVFEEGDGTLDGYIKVRGTLENLNRALAEATYQPDPHWNTHYKEMDSVEIELYDLDISGLHGSGPHYKVTKTMYIEVLPENDKPLIHVPGDHRTYDYDGQFAVDKIDTIHCDEDERVFIDQIKVDDIDASEQPGALMEIELWSSNGTFTLQSIVGLTVIHGGHDESHHFQAKGNSTSMT